MAFWMKAFSRTAPVHPEDAGRDSRIDAFVERYVDWREECEALDSAYRRWARATASERDLAFAAYRATLDREEQSARAYELAAAPLEGSERE